MASVSVTRILLPVDFSSGSHAAIDVAGLMALSFGASVVLFHASEAPTAMESIVPGATIEDDLVNDRADAVRRLAAIGADLRARGVKRVEQVVVVGPPGHAIVGLARAGRCDLIVMGTHGRTGVARLVMGSVAEEVVRHAACAVMTIRMPVAGRPTLG